MPKALKGVMAIAQTPFTDADEIDLAALKRSVDWAFDVGTDGIGSGLVTETFKLTVAERNEIARLLVEFTAGRGPVFAAVGAESTKQALAFAVAAEKAGCDAVMAVPPLTGRLPEAQLVDHFSALAESVSIPVIVQDASAYVGQAIPISASVTLLDRFGPDKLLFKPEGAPNGPTMSAIRDATGGRARMFEGSGGVFLIDSFRRGVCGTMPSIDLLDGVVAVWKAMSAGDEARAYRVYFPLCAIVSLQMQAGLDGYLAIEKYLLVKKGLFTSARRRKPYTWDLDHETAAEVDRLFEQLQASLTGSKSPAPR
jgi:4-hydroxy-tetrahydrodipicolinate synthase